MTRDVVLPWLALVVFGAGWGLMQPMTKIAVDGGFEPFGIMVWQGAVTLCLAGGLAVRKGLPKGGAQWLFCAQIAILGTLIPHFASFTAIGFISAGLVAIIMALIPIFALTFGALVGREALTPLRITGILMGLGAMMLIAITRGAVGAGPLWAVAVAAIAPLCYAINSTITVTRGMAGLHPLQAYAGAAMIFLPISLFGAVWSDQLRGVGVDLESFAVLVSAVGHTLIYAGYLWLLTRSGAVFASQTAYLVTGFGVIWSMLILGERYSSWVWVALILMLAGLSLVRPTVTRSNGTCAGSLTTRH
ncbi:MAG: DMT family transporter [Octadecabacter sp.]|nr:DMT family transporter [Octadecabacter sp.]